MTSFWNAFRAVAGTHRAGKQAPDSGRPARVRPAVESLEHRDQPGNPLDLFATLYLSGLPASLFDHLIGDLKHWGATVGDGTYQRFAQALAAHGQATGHAHTNSLSWLSAHMFPRGSSDAQGHRTSQTGAAPASDTIESWLFGEIHPSAQARRPARGTAGAPADRRSAQASQHAGNGHTALGDIGTQSHQYLEAGGSGMAALSNDWMFHQGTSHIRRTVTHRPTTYVHPRQSTPAKKPPSGSPKVAGHSTPPAATAPHAPTPPNTAGTHVTVNPPVNPPPQISPPPATQSSPPSPQGVGQSNSASFGLSIPEAHPRIWWTPARLTQARAWYAAHPFTPQVGDPWNNALVYVLTGNSTSAQNAIQSLMAFNISDQELSNTASDVYRWSDWVPVVYDWVHDAMTPAQRQTFMDRYNHYAETIMQKSWGGPTMPGDNYFWGYFRNELNWGIATYHENPMAESFLRDALVTRWQQSFLPYATSGSGLGGVAPEGAQYGRYMLQYPVMPLTSAQLVGRDLWNETNFFKEALFQTIYATTPSPTTIKGASGSYYQVFPFGDVETDGGYPSAGTSYLGDFMTAMAGQWGGQPAGQYARQWLRMVQPSVDNYVAAVDLGASARDFSGLPTDYYAAGSQYLYTRNQWGPDATSLFLQLGEPTGGSHTNLDAGSFQIWRDGAWLSKESTGYDTQFAGGVTSHSTAAHNGILFNGVGLANAYQDGSPQVLRLQSTDLFSYAAVDLSPAYRAHASSHPERDDNPYAAHAVREFLFIKPLQTLVSLDRLESSGDAVPAASVTKSFLLHFPVAPQIAGNTVTGINGQEELKLTALTPGVSFDVVDEGAFSGAHAPPSYYQYRLEENASGQAQTYLLNVMQAKSVGGPEVAVSMTQDSTSWTIHLDSPALGHATIVLQKGMTSSGGAVGYSTAGTPTNLSPLLNHVQSIQVTDQGPQWGA